jgi:hypothetical protein
MSSKSQKIQNGHYEITVTLIGLEPPIWRRVLVPIDILLGDLHNVIQVAMGWENSHLHEFVIGKKRYGTPLDEEYLDDDCVEELGVYLNGVAKPRAKFVYVYDFGDDWEHQIKIEREVGVEGEKRVVRCLAGERACPPEDSGGVWGYADMLSIVGTPGHSERAEFIEWLGEGFDPEYFDLEDVDRQLSCLEV